MYRHTEISYKHVKSTYIIRCTKNQVSGVNSLDDANEILHQHVITKITK